MIKHLKSLYLKLTLPIAEYRKLLSFQSEEAKGRRLQRKKRRERICSNRNFQKNNSHKDFALWRLNKDFPFWRKDVKDMI